VFPAKARSHSQSVARHRIGLSAAAGAVHTAIGLFQTHKIAARRPDVPRDHVECRRSPDCHDLTISSVFRGIKSIEFLRPGDVVAPDHNMAEHRIPSYQSHKRPSPLPTSRHRLRAEVCMTGQCSAEEKNLSRFRSRFPAACGQEPGRRIGSGP